MLKKYLFLILTFTTRCLSVFVKLIRGVFLILIIAIKLFSKSHYFEVFAFLFKHICMLVQVKLFHNQVPWHT